METVKVDIQKLQLLNDRITQTIEALNQLRMSVHGIGIQHTSSPYGYGMYGSPYQQFTPSFGPSFSPYGGGGWVQPSFVPNFVANPGLSHSTWEPHWNQQRSVQWQPTTTQWQPTFTPVY